MSEIRERIDDLIKQATTERSHFYVASLLKDLSNNYRIIPKEDKVEDWVEVWQAYTNLMQANINLKWKDTNE